MTVGERIKTLSQDWFLTEPLLFAVLCTHALKRNDNMGCDMRCGKGLIEYNPERLEHFDGNWPSGSRPRWCASSSSIPISVSPITRAAT